MPNPLNLFEDALLCYCRAKGFQEYQWLSLLVYAEFILRQEAIQATEQQHRSATADDAAPGQPHEPLPYPQTPETAKAWLHSRGICVSHWARDLHLSRAVVVDALRGRLKGNRGEANRVAIALGLKPKPEPDQAAINSPAMPPERRVNHDRRAT